MEEITAHIHCCVTNYHKPSSLNTCMHMGQFVVSAGQQGRHTHWVPLAQGFSRLSSWACAFPEQGSPSKLMWWLAEFSSLPL